MKIKILGSGGCTCLPRPACNCGICHEAREKGKPFARNGCSIYIEDINLLVDTPEDIVESLNYHKIMTVDSVIYSHWDPDHTSGMRVFEQLRIDWAKVSIGIENDNPINVYTLPQVCEDIKKIQNKYGSYLGYYQDVRNLIKINPVESNLQIQDIRITFVPVGEATVFVFEQNDKKLIYAPCDVKPFPESDVFHNSDLMIIGSTIPVDTIKNDFLVEQSNPLWTEFFSMDEIMELKSKYNIDKVVVTHLEEEWGLSYTDYEELAKEYDAITFAYDGMNVEV